MGQMKVLSLGWGWQSFCISAMAALGEIEMPDVAIHADTTHEASGTYAFAKQWTPWLEERGVRVVTVQDKSPRIVTDRVGGKIFVPAFTGGKYLVDSKEYEISYDEYGDEIKGDIIWEGKIEVESQGQLRRQCTQRWKIAPIRRWLQANQDGRPVEMWIGISLDEVQRMKDSDVKYITHRWPLIEKRMTRAACATWLERHNLPTPPKSACVFCPFHDTRAWHDMKASGNGDWHKALEVDESIRKVRPPYDLFLHPSRQPLALVDFSNAEERGQLSLWNEECSGICGV